MRTNISNLLSNRVPASYLSLMEVVFYVFIFCTFSFGRAFSALYVNTPISPVFVTEIFLFLSMPVLFLRLPKILVFPRIFLVFLLAFFGISSAYLIDGILDRNIFALRDITLSGYILFLPLTLIYLNSIKKIKIIMAVFIFSNVINLYSGWCLLRNVYFSETFHNFISQGSFSCFGLYYGIAVSLIISFYKSLNLRFHRACALVLLFSNFYMLVILSQRSLWLALSLLLVFFFLIHRRVNLKSALFYVSIFLIVLSVLFCLDSKLTSSSSISAISSKIKSSVLFMRGVTYKYELANKAVEFNTVSAVQLSQKQIDDSKVIGNRGNEIVLLKNKPVKTSIEEKHSLGNIAWRLSIWKQTLNFAKDSPLFGKGFGVYPDYEIWGGIHQSPKGIYLNSRIVPAHNDLITVFFKMGIFGLAIFLFLNIYVFIFAFAYLKKCKSRFIYNLLVFLLGSFMFWHVLALFFDTIDSPPTNIVLWIIMGLIFLAVGNDKGLVINVEKTQELP